MGAGQFPAGGFTPAGLDPVYRPSPAAPPAERRALKYDPSIRRFALFDDQGNVIDVHPVDQIVALRCTTFRGQSKSQPDLGTRLNQIVQQIDPARVPQAAQQEIARVLADLVDAGDVLLKSVTTSFDPSGRYVFVISYINLRTAPNANPDPGLTNLEVAT